jgi:hypothetical protein
VAGSAVGGWLEQGTGGAKLLTNAALVNYTFVAGGWPARAVPGRLAPRLDLSNMAPRTPSSSAPRLAVAALLLAAIGCGGTGRTTAATPPPITSSVRPLAPLVPQNIVVTPLLALREADTLGWSQAIPNRREFLRSVDEQMQAALRERGLTRPWIFPEALARAAQRNPGHAIDPYQLAMEPLRRRERLQVAERLPEPLASQIRTIVALHDARFVILPLELYFEPVGQGEGRAVLRLAFADARLSDIQWVGDVRSDPASRFDPAVAAELGRRFADLVIAP